MKPRIPSVVPGLLLTLGAPLLAQGPTRVSVSTGGAEGDGHSFGPALSLDGRFVAFYSEATNLVAGDANGAEDVFVHDRRTATTTRVSVDSAGVEGNEDSYDPVLSADGRFVAFYSDATNLVPGDTNGATDVFVHDRLTGATTRVSVDSTGAQGDDRSLYPVLSADGRYVAFYSWATNLVAGDTNGVQDVFVHDRASGTTTRVSVSSTGAQADGYSQHAAISADGNRVAFVSLATNLVAGDTNGTHDVFVRDIERSLTVRVSVDSNGVQGDGTCSYPSISGDGRFVGFESGSSNLVPGDTNGVTDSFVHDLLAGTTTRVSVSSAGGQGNALSLRASLSFDGRYVAFKSEADNLVPGDTNDTQDIFLRDMLLGVTLRVNVDANGAQAQGRSSQPVIFARGRHVAYYSLADNLVPGDTNGAADVFVR